MTQVVKHGELLNYHFVHPRSTISSATTTHKFLASFAIFQRNAQEVHVMLSCFKLAPPSRIEASPMDHDVGVIRKCDSNRRHKATCCSSTRACGGIRPRKASLFAGGGLVHVRAATPTQRVDERCVRPPLPQCTGGVHSAAEAGAPPSFLGPIQERS